MIKILITGLPGSGKTTQACLLADALDVCLIKTGDVLRELAQEVSVIGRKLKRSLEKGELADDKLVAEIIRERVKKPDCKRGFVMDGYPRSMSQLKYFDPRYDRVFFLKIPVDEARRRLSVRSRSDDNPEAIEMRLSIQTQELAVLLGYFKKSNHLVEIDGQGTTEQIHKAIKTYLV